MQRSSQIQPWRWSGHEFAGGESDAENRLVSVTIIATGHRSEFGYDGLGRRVTITEKDPDANQNLQVTSDKKYLWDGAEIAEERTADGGTVLKRFYDQGFVDTDGTVLYYTKDHLGSIRELTDSSQTVRARYDYDPYGRMTKTQGDRDSLFGYTGHTWHVESGLNLTLYRAYDPNLGRWLSQDPIGTRAGTNVYAYVLNSPSNFIDLFGLQIEEVIDSPIWPEIGDELGPYLIPFLPFARPNSNPIPISIPAPPPPPCKRDGCTCTAEITIIDLARGSTFSVGKVSASGKTCAEAQKRLFDYAQASAGYYRKLNGTGYQAKHINKVNCVEH